MVPRQRRDPQKHRWARLAAAVCGSLLASVPVPSAAADPCPDVEVVFARGSGEAPGVGGIGQPFIDALRSDLGNRSLTVYAVNYPASTDFSSPDFPLTVIEKSMIDAPRGTGKT